MCAYLYDLSSFRYLQYAYPVIGYVLLNTYSQSV